MLQDCFPFEHNDHLEGVPIPYDKFRILYILYLPTILQHQLPC